MDSWPAKTAAVTRTPRSTGRPASAASPAVSAVTASEGIGWHDRASAGISVGEDMTRASSGRVPRAACRVPREWFALQCAGSAVSLRVDCMTTLAGVHSVLPPHRYTQAELTSVFTEVCLGPDGNRALLGRLHANAKVSSRHLVLPLEQYATLSGFR